MKQMIRHSVYLILACWLGAASSPAFAQVKIAPAALFLSDDEPTGRILVHNSSGQPQEISIEMVYSYPVTDSTGQVVMKTFKTIPEDAPSAVEWVRVYPRHLVLPPNEQQIIRFSARPPGDLPPGEYWARPSVSVSALRSSPPPGSGFLSTRLHLINRTLLSLRYRKQPAFTGLSVKGFSIEATPNQLQVSIKLERLGNASYLGDLHIGVYSGAEEILQQHQPVAVYKDQVRRLSLDISELPPGQYQARATFDTRPRTSRQTGILEASPVSAMSEFIKK